MPVAIRAITRLQDADDINVSLGAGVDEYALCWDNDTARFVLRAPTDLSGYLLKSGGTMTGVLSLLSATNTIQMLEIGSGGGAAYLTIGGSGSGGYIRFVANRTVNFIVPATGRMLFSATDTGNSAVLGIAYNVNAFVFDKPASYFGGTVQATAIITGGIRPAADSTTALQLQNAAGTSVLNVDTTNQRVGIGTTAPAQKLEVAGNLAFTTGTTRIISGPTSFDLELASTQNLNFYGGSFTPLRLFKGAPPYSNSGNVVGFCLNINAADDASIGFFADLSESSTYRARGSGSTANPTLIRSNLGNLRFYTDTGKTDLATYTPTERMIITNGGSVGIGASSPKTRLDIGAGALTMAEMTAPTGVADKAMLYTKDNGSGKTQLCCKLGDDVEIVIATQA